MTARKERIQQTAAGTWVAASTIPIALDKIGLVTRYECTFEITPSATAFGANQADSFWRPFRNLTFAAGGVTYMTLPDDAGGHDATLQHYLNVKDGFGQGYVHQLIVAPSQTFYPPRLVFHCGVRPQRRDGVDNPFDATGFLPAGIESSPQISWQTTANTVMDDTITLSSGTLNVVANRILGDTEEIKQEMADQGVEDILDLVRQGAEGAVPDDKITGFVPGWAVDLEQPAATAANYGLQLNMQLGGWNKRTTFLVQDATATRPTRSDDTLTQLKLSIPEKSLTLLQLNTEALAAWLKPGDFLAGDEADPLGGNAAPGGIYVVDLRPLAPTTVEQVLGLDTRGRQTGYAIWGQTIATNTSGDDILVLTERMMPYHGRLANS